MSPIQTSYGERMKNCSPGTIGGSHYNTHTGICGEEDGIGFGLAVSQGADSDKQVALGGALVDFLGITVRDVVAGRLSTDPVDAYGYRANLAYVGLGQIWVQVASPVAKDDPVHYNATTGAIANSGGNGPIPGARFVTSSDADGRVLVELMARGA